MSRRGTITTERRSRVKSTRPAVRVGPVILLSLVLLMVGWSMLWLFARHEAAVAFAGWLQGERSQGRVWTCPGEQVKGYPLGIEITCDQPTFKGAVADGVFEGTMARLSAKARLYFPTNVIVALSSPLQAHEVGGDRTVRATWASASLLLRGTLPGNLDHGEFQADTLVLDDGGSSAEAANRIDHLEIDFRPVTRTTDARSDLEANLVLSNAHLPQLDALVGFSEPLSLELKGFATQVAFNGEATLPAILDPWSHAGGQVHLQSFALTKGAFKAEGDGRLGLDEDHRVEGRLDTRFSGLEPIAERLGIPLGAVQIGGVLSGLLGGKSAAPDSEPGDMAMPLIAKNGRLYVGPVKTGIVMTPLY